MASVVVAILATTTTMKFNIISQKQSNFLINTSFFAHIYCKISYLFYGGIFEGKGMDPRFTFRQRNTMVEDDGWWCCAVGLEGQGHGYQPKMV